MTPFVISIEHLFVLIDVPKLSGKSVPNNFENLALLSDKKTISPIAPDISSQAVIVNMSFVAKQSISATPLPFIA